MTRFIRQVVSVAVVLLLTAQRLPAPITVLPEETPASEPVPKKKAKVVNKEKIHPRKKAEPVASPKPTPAVEVPPAAGNPTAATPAAAPEQSLAPSADTHVPAASGSVTRRMTVKPSPHMEVVYTIFATHPFDSPLTGQTIRVSVTEHGKRDVALQSGKVIPQDVNFTLNTAINTGKTKSLAQVCAVMKDVFRRFMYGGTTPNQELGKVGDARYGGEVHFVAESPDTLRFDYVPTPASGGNNFRFKREDIEEFVELLAL